MKPPFGILNFDKPSGPTSRDIVNRVQWLLRKTKVGHAGTLDPLATGVLLVCVGPATRLVEQVQQLGKTYEGTFLLGRQSDTEDIEGSVQELESPNVPAHSEIEAVLPEFLGTIEQVPPAYSALKVDGKRGYQLARAGKKVDMKPRQVRIDRLELLEYDYPKLRLRIECGSGTYIRSLGRDLARRVGTEAVMSELTRTAIGNFTLENAVSPQNLSRETIEQNLLPAGDGVRHLPQVTLDPDAVAGLKDGRLIPHPLAAKHVGQPIAAFNQEQELVAILLAKNERVLRPWRNFANVATASS